MRRWAIVLPSRRPQPQQSQQSRVTGHTLLPAEHQSLNQQIARLAAATGEPTGKIWGAALKLVNLTSGDPIPACHFSLLT
nr:Tripartite tricarboxylate transporter TctA family protein [Candidatus Pantoea persica]